VFREIIRSRWFALADLALVSLSIAMWELQPKLGWWPLLIALSPWTLRLVAGDFLFKRTGFEGPLVIFLVTAVVGIWTAYDRQTAWAKFWLLVGAVLLFYALASQPPGNLWPLVVFFALVGSGVAVFFLLTHDWANHPAKISVLNQVGLWWQKFRPSLPFGGIHPNDAASVMAMMFPFLVAIAKRAWEKKYTYSFWAFIGIGALMSTAFLLTTSRGAWIAFSIVMGVSFLWLFSARVRLFHLSRRAIFTAALALLIVVSLLVLGAYPGGLVGLAATLPGPNNAVSRLDLAIGTLDLIADFPLTGGGLSTFPGLYSQYILMLPSFITSISHNFFLDIALEQGILGLLAFGIILAGTFYVLISHGGSRSTLRWAVLAGLGVMVLHGLVDDVVYNIWGVPLLFILPGFTVAISHQKDNRRVIGLKAHWSDRSWKLGVVITSSLIFIALLFAFRAPLLSAWYADLGAVHTARVELADFPSGEWDDGSRMEALSPAVDLFQRALQLNPDNRTAHHRLGLIAMLRRDFSNAVTHLNRAHELDAGHRGIRKALGYSYVWAGQLEEAMAMLAEIPEAKQEMSVYAWWWGTQDRPDLSTHAKTANLLLEEDE
jgi:O-antigen ligase